LGFAFIAQSCSIVASVAAAAAVWNASPDGIGKLDHIR